MRRIVPDVYVMEGLRGGRGHVYLLASEGGLTLVDSGMAGVADQIVAQLEEEGYALSDLRNVNLWQK